MMQELTIEQLVQVLVTPKNALTRQFNKQFQLDGCRLHITAKAMQAIAVIAKEKGTGARGLRHLMESLFLDAKFVVSPITRNM